MQKDILKTISAAVLLSLAALDAAPQTPVEIVEVGQGQPPVTVASDCRCLIFSSMDWFSSVRIYDTETGRNIYRSSIRLRDRSETSQLVFVDFSEWPNSEYAIVLKGDGRTETARLVISDDRCILVE